MKNNNRYILPGIILLAIILRCIFINSRGIQYDDAFSIFLSQQSINNIVSGTAADTMPPLYYFLLHFWMFGGQGIWYLRLLSLILSLGGIIIIYSITDELFGRIAALTTALLSAVSPLQIYHAQDIRMYALLQLAQLTFIWFFVKIWLKQPGSENKLYWLGLILCGAMSLYSHNLGGFILIIPAAFLFLSRSWRLLWRYLAAMLPVIVLFLPWAAYLPGQFNKVQHAFWTPRPGVVEVLQVIIQWMSNLPLPNMLFIGTAAVLGLQVITMLLLEFRSDIRAQNNKYLIMLLWLGIPLMTFILSYLVRPIFVARGFLVSSMFFYALVGWFYSRHQKDFLGLLILICFAGGALMGLPYQLTFESFPRSPFQKAAEYLSQVDLSNSVIIHDNKLSYFPMQYYQTNNRQIFLPDKPGSINDTFAKGSQTAMNIFPAADLETAVKHMDSVYFVVFEETIEEYRNMGYADHPQLAWLKQHYDENKTIDFNDLEVYHFNGWH
ncbi:MAG: glycosyltransferase family 39 protein [Anaerolineae bacterium]|nr:glycosyltransferase family 39 protein [Anaerolineae bacterium]